MDRSELTDIRWRKARRSADTGDCIVVAWRKSGHSAETGSCVELAAGTGAVLVRDSRDPDGPRLSFGADAWRAFMERIKA